MICAAFLTIFQGKDARVSAAAALKHKFFEGYTHSPVASTADDAALRAFASARMKLNELCEEPPVMGNAGNMAKLQQIKDACEGVGQEQEEDSA
jgi:hypothetical protein